MDLVIGLFVAAMARWVWPGCIENVRCRRRGCRECTLLVPCDEALRRLCTKLPRARLQAAELRRITPQAPS